MSGWKETQPEAPSEALGESALPRASASARKTQALNVQFNFHWSSLQLPATLPATACLERKTNTNKI